MGGMRILSLLPAATEMVYLLGLENQLVGVSHDCDYPPQVKNISKLTSSPISNAMSSLEIDMAVKKLGHRGNGVLHIDQKMLKRLNPDLILTQELCEVCAVGFNQVQKAARILDGEVKIISFEPESVEDILENILLVGQVMSEARAGALGYRLQAQKAVQKLKKRIENLKLKIVNSTKPKVCVVEWLDPVMAAGHWVPEMIKVAGGLNLVSKMGEKSRKINVAQKQLNSDILIISPCGFDIKRTIRERFMINDLRLKINNKNTKIYLVDGNSYMTRPGPRIIDGIEILSEIIHPEVFKRRYTKKDWIQLK